MLKRCWGWVKNNYFTYFSLMQRHFFKVDIIMLLNHKDFLQREGLKREIFLRPKYSHILTWPYQPFTLNVINYTPSIKALYHKLVT